MHAVVKEITTINNVDLLKIRNMMLEKWICKTGPAVNKVCPLEYIFILFKLDFSIFGTLCKRILTNRLSV